MSAVVRKPAYYEEFRCIGGSCPDSCCKEWEVQVDSDSASRFRNFDGELGEKLRRVLVEEDGEIYMQSEDGHCPMWRADGLCSIQAECGEEALCHTCRQFPRLSHEYCDYLELGLELSCPEAARLILSGYGFEPCGNVDEIAAGAELSGDVELLLKRREKLRLLLRDEKFSIGERLAIMLMFAYDVQAELDGEEELPFDASEALSQARSFAKCGSEEEFVGFFAGLEILSQEWLSRLSSHSCGVWCREHLYLAEYFMDRYWLQASSDGDLICRAKFILVSCLLVKLLGGELRPTAQRYSKEIENNIDNVEKILDAAYTNSAFTDDKLLGYLLEITAE